MQCSLFISLIFLITSVNLCFSKDNLLVNIGSEIGLSSSNHGVSQSVLIQINEGVTRKNKESIYYMGILKLYGISHHKSDELAAQYFLEAAELGHIEAMTAYCVLKMKHMVSSSEVQTIKSWLRKAVESGDVNAHWLLGK